MKVDIMDTGLIPVLGRSLGGGNDNSLQYSCLENSLDSEFWQATVHGVTKMFTLNEEEYAGSIFWERIRLRGKKHRHRTAWESLDGTSRNSNKEKNQQQRTESSPSQKGLISKRRDMGFNPICCSWEELPYINALQRGQVSEKPYVARD